MCSLKFVMVLLFFASSAIKLSTAAYNVVSNGARADGKTDSTRGFLRAWQLACGSAKAATIVVPEGRFMVKSVEFRGPCRKRITFLIYGTIVAPNDYRALGNSGKWILFVKVNGLLIKGGTIDAQGAGYWACRRSGKNCPVGARSLMFNWANDVEVSGLTSINSQVTHFVINSCNNILVRNVKLYAPDQSPNTDGIHVQSSTGVTITSTTLKTGDDCISIGPGTRNLLMSKIYCGPGHGVSVGSLGKDSKDAGVENITLTDSFFSGSDNGVRIKTWARPSSATVRNVLFQNLVMRNVRNPIIIDQNYCPDNKGCSRQSSGVKISQVTYRNIQGTSATPQAMIFDCSRSNPCRGIKLQDIKLTFMNNAAFSSCKNIGGISRGVLVPKSCL